MKKILLSCLLFSFFLAGCRLTSVDKFDMVDSVKIGFIGPLSGDAKSYGLPISQAVQMAVDEINQNGGIKGKKPIELILEDGLCENNTASTAAQKLINQDQVEMIIGGVCSSETIGAAPQVEAAQVVLLSPSSSSPDLTTLGDYIFRNTTSDSDIGKALANLMIKKYQNTAIITESTDYAIDLKNVFEEEFKKNGGKIAISTLYSPDETDFQSILTEIKQSPAQAIVINPQTELTGGQIVKQIGEMGIKLPLYGSNVVSGKKAIEIAGKYSEGIIVADNPSLDRSNPLTATFLKNFQQKYGQPSFEFYLGAAYDDVYLFKQAVEEAGLDGATIKNYFNKLKNYSGVLGDYRFDKNGDLVWIKYSIKEIKSGEAIEKN